MIFSKLALVAPGLATAVRAVEKSNKVSFYTDDVDLFPTLPREHITHLLSGWDDMGMEFGGILFHDTEGPSANQTASSAPKHARDIGDAALLLPRAPAAQCEGNSCYNTGGYKFFTVAHEEFIAGKLRPLVVTAASAGILGSIIVIGISATCGDDINKCTLLTGFVAGTSFAYVPVAKAIAAVGEPTLKSIESSCSIDGSSAACYDSGKRGTYKLQAEQATSTCPARVSKCSKVTCDSSRIGISSRSTEKVDCVKMNVAKRKMHYAF